MFTKDWGNNCKSDQTFQDLEIRENLFCISFMQLRKTTNYVLHVIFQCSEASIRRSDASFLFVPRATCTCTTPRQSTKSPMFSVMYPNFKRGSFEVNKCRIRMDSFQINWMYLRSAVERPTVKWTNNVLFHDFQNYEYSLFFFIIFFFSKLNNDSSVVEKPTCGAFGHEMSCVEIHTQISWAQEQFLQWSFKWTILQTFWIFYKNMEGLVFKTLSQRVWPQ